MAVNIQTSSIFNQEKKFLEKLIFSQKKKSFFKSSAKFYKRTKDYAYNHRAILYNSCYRLNHPFISYKFEFTATYQN